MERICKFVKETNGDWFIDLPEWQGERAALQMVLGADTLLDIIAQGKKEILIHFSDEGFPGANVMSWVNDGLPNNELTPEELEIGGATYHMEFYKGIGYDFKLWLCDVTTFVFGEFPEHIYFSCLSEV